MALSIAAFCTVTLDGVDDLEAEAFSQVFKFLIPFTESLSMSSPCPLKLLRFEHRVQEFDSRYVEILHSRMESSRNAKRLLMADFQLEPTVPMIALLSESKQKPFRGLTRGVPTALPFFPTRSMHWFLFIKLYVAVALLYVIVSAAYVSWRFWPRK